MKRVLVIVLTLALAGEAAAEITKWWGSVSFRQRREIDEEFVDTPDHAKWGDLRERDENTKTRVGYQVGFLADIYDNLTAGVTFRSGLRPGGTGSVMLQDIDNESGLLPGLQEAYLDWQTPYADVLMGKFPQRGNAMWDLYAAPLWTDFRQDDPRDGVFNDRIAALSGVRVIVPVGSVKLRGTYHTDFVGGGRRHQPEGSSGDDAQILGRLDQKTFLLGAEIDFGQYIEPYVPDLIEGAQLILDFDFGRAYREGDRQKTGSDSTYAEESLWGYTLKMGPEWLDLQLGYGYNSRDSVFKSDFFDVILAGELFDTRITGRYQDNKQEQQIGIYKDHIAERFAYHIYLNRKVWNLDIQPRYIWFLTKIDGTKTATQRRYEVTATARF